VTTQRPKAGARFLETLFQAGTATGRTDGQLLEWFATGGPEATELAFTALVERHGPMVLRTCRAVLRDDHAAQDAFQATFLILVRRGPTLWVRDSLAPWLHRVARHAAVRARRDALRRTSAEQSRTRMGIRTEPATDEAPGDDLGSLIHEEVDRLPERYRAVVVLCDLDRATYEEAARHLGCPVGTVKSRVARGRARLRANLTRRGLAPEGMLPPAKPAEGAQATVPAALAEATTRTAIRFAAVPAGGSGAIPAAVIALTEGVLSSMFLSSLRRAALLPLLLVLAMGGLAAGTGLRTQQPRKPEPEKPLPAAVPAPAQAWRRFDTYEPPDFDRFFPDDAEGGFALEALWNDANKDKLPVEETLRAVRRGLRRTRAPGDAILAWIGEKHIWKAAQQNPDAIEIFYHAADFRSRHADHIRDTAVYYGLSVVQPKTPAILRTLVDMSMTETMTDWGRVAWGVQSQRDELPTYLKPYLTSGDEATREKAAVLANVLRGDPDANQAVTAWTKKTIRAKFGDRLPALRQAIAAGSPRERIAALNLLLFERIYLMMDASFVAAFTACAGDNDPAVRKAVAETLGTALMAFDGAQQQADALGVLLGLSEDEDDDVCYQTVYHGLTPLPPVRREEVIRRLLEMVMSLTERVSARAHGFYDRVAWGLEPDRDGAAKVLDEMIRGNDPERARAAREIYKDMTGREPLKTNGE
jgi:RNA polymerase sigma factor (sigma-70 family)